MRFQIVQYHMDLRKKKMKNVDWLKDPKDVRIKLNPNPFKDISI